MDGTFATHLASIDSAMFVGRTGELRIAHEFLSDATHRRLMWVCGEGGIGKSAFLREVGRVASSLGYTVHRLDGREVQDDAAAFDVAARSVWEDARPLLLIDGYDRMRPLGPHLRSNVLPLLPLGARVVVARRSQVEAEWSQDGWDKVSLAVMLGALPNADARELLLRLDVGDDAGADNLVQWAAGLPLALTAGAELALSLDERPDERTTFESWVGPGGSPTTSTSGPWRASRGCWSSYDS